MTVVRTKQQERDGFFAERRLAILSSNGEPGCAVSVPLWYGSGRAVPMFRMGTAGKIQRLRRDPRASALVTSTFGEPLSWGAFDGRVTIEESTGLEAAERSLTRYVGDLDAGLGRDSMALFRSVAPLLVELHLVPESIRPYAEVHR